MNPWTVFAIIVVLFFLGRQYGEAARREDQLRHELEALRGENQLRHELEILRLRIENAAPTAPQTDTDGG